MTGRGSAGRGRAPGPGCAPSYPCRRSAPVLTLARGDPSMTATGHVCRSSMSGVHHDMGINDHAFTRFIEITGQQALAAGVSKSDVDAVAARLETYRGSIVRT